MERLDDEKVVEVYNENTAADVKGMRRPLAAYYRLNRSNASCGKHDRLACSITVVEGVGRKWFSLRCRKMGETTNTGKELDESWNFGECVLTEVGLSMVNLPRDL